jgi:hypothetical protein
VTKCGQIIFKALPEITGHVGMQKIEREDERQHQATNLISNYGMPLPNRLPSHCLDFFLLSYVAHQR